jgi:type I restriction enzyme S subunit
MFNPVFVQAYLSSAEGRKSLLERAKTSAGQFNINTESLASIEIPMIPIEQQERFAAIVMEAENRNRSYREGAISADALFASLQSRAFSGQL